MTKICRGVIRDFLCEVKIVPKRGDFGTIEKFLYIRKLKNYNVDEKTGTGFSFESYNAHYMLDTIRYAEKIYYDFKEDWNNIVERGMRTDFSWNASARKYEALYDELYEDFLAAEKARIAAEKKAAKQIALALERGKAAQEFRSMERSFLEGECKYGNTAIAYNNFCYIFSEDGVCVTLYPLPIWFGKKKQFNGKEKVRNPKKYTKYCAQAAVFS